MARSDVGAVTLTVALTRTRAGVYRPLVVGRAVDPHSQR
jgi:hypothetical protein